MADQQSPAILDDDDDIFSTPQMQVHDPLNSKPSAATNNNGNADLFLDGAEDIDLNDDEPASIGGGNLVLEDTSRDENVSTTPPLLERRDSLESPSVTGAGPGGVKALLITPQTQPLAAQVTAPTSVLNPMAASTTPYTSPLAQSTTGQPQPLPASRTSKHSEQPTMEERPKYEYTIDVCEHEKRGDGMNTFYAYKVQFKPVDIPMYKKASYEVWRRFSDFLGLHEKLHAKHAHVGRIIPPVPEKNPLDAAKTRITEDENNTANDFLERRRCSLERFVRRCAQHPVLLLDVDFRDFVTLEAELPRATQTSALSGAGIKRMFKGVGDALNKITIKIDENDRWFEEKQNEVDALYETLEKLNTAADTLVHYRRELASGTDSFAKSLSMLAACEENTNLSRTIAQLAETQEKVALVQRDQAEKDFYLLSEMLRDTLGMLGAVRATFYERQKVWHNWQMAEVTLNRKREAKTRLELAGKSEKVPAAKNECEQAERAVSVCEEEFGAISKMIRQEMVHFDLQRITHFKEYFIKYLDSLQLTQQQLVKYWDAFLPEARAIMT